MDENEDRRMLWAQQRFGHGSCHWLGAHEGYLLLGWDWAGCAYLADEGVDVATLESADVAALGPLVNLFVSWGQMVQTG